MTVLVTHPFGIPVPRPSVLTRPFWEACAERRLTYQRCGACGFANFVTPGFCRSCGSDELVWRDSDGAGTVFSWSVVHRPASPAFRSPYGVAIVQLSEGFQMLANLVDVAVEAIRCEMPVQVQFHEIDQAGFVLPYFAPA